MGLILNKVPNLGCLPKIARYLYQKEWLTQRDRGQFNPFAGRYLGAF